MLKLNTRLDPSLSPVAIDRTMVLKVTTDCSYPLPLRGKAAFLFDGQISESPSGFAAILYRTDLVPAFRDGTNHFRLSAEFEYLTDGDIIRITTDLTLRVMYRKGTTNFFLVTERCNSFCIMCSQPPRDIDDRHLVKEWLDVIPMMPEGTPEVGITGGEPTLLGEDFFELLKAIRSYLPYTSVHILTNGRNFQDINLAKKVASIGLRDVMLGIPLYSNIASVHDFIVQADGAFDETIRGILNLKRCGVPIELRIVIHAQNASELPAICEFIGRNLQFVDQVALMALEPTGFAKANMSSLWVDSYDYQEPLLEAVNILKRARVSAILFNHQLCLLPRSLWPIAVQSISDWKNEYLDACSGCEVKSRCAGFFSSAEKQHLSHISPIKL